MTNIERPNNMSNIDSKRYKASDLQLKQTRRMYNAGFSRYEIKYTLLIGKKNGAETLQKMFDSADFAKAFEKELFNRSRWTERQLSRGKTKEQIREVLNRDEKKKGIINPFSFLKEEYQRGQQPKSDYIDYLSDSERVKINKWSRDTFGTKYSTARQPKLIEG